MIRTVMESANLAIWPMLSLLLFAVFTLALCLWLYRRGSQPFYDRMSRLAMDDDASHADWTAVGRKFQPESGAPERKSHGNA